MNAPPNLNHFVAGLLIEEFHRCGVRAIGLAPGSRSSPLAEAAASHRRMKLVVHPDERGLAFHMLGHAKAGGRPAVVITTSGTAAANLFPAVAEAHHAGVPLILCTADRPPELRGCGANQTTDQVKLFGAFVRDFIDLPPPQENIPPSLWLAAVDQAVAAALAQPHGPVHLNCMFRDPLAPVKLPYPYRRLQRALQDWPQSAWPWVRHARPAPETLAGWSTSDELLRVLRRARSGIILAGALPAGDGEAVAALADALGWPLLPDIQSGLRAGAPHPAVIPHADLLLSSGRFASSAPVDVLLQFGSAFVTRRLLDFAATVPARTRIVVDPAPGRVDPAHRSAWRFTCAPGPLAESISSALGDRPRSSECERWQRASERVEQILDRKLGLASALSEPALAWTLSRLLPADHALFLGNSLPIRLAATFGSARAAAYAIGANRGLSGIDGELASAVGFAMGSGRTTTAVLGDLTALHDLNSLALVRASRIPVILVIVNNDGGGIFSLLPVAGTSQHFERVFGTPHGLDFPGAAGMFGIPYSAPATRAGFIRAWRAAVRAGRSAIIEIKTRRADTARVVRALQQAVSRTLDSIPA